MKHTITLTTEEETFLQDILKTKFKTNGIIPTVDQVLTTYIEKKIAELKKEQDRYAYAKKLESRWDSLTDKQKEQIKYIVDVQKMKEI